MNVPDQDVSLSLWPRLRTGEVSPFVILRPVPKVLAQDSE